MLYDCVLKETNASFLAFYLMFKFIDRQIYYLAVLCAHFLLFNDSKNLV